MPHRHAQRTGIFPRWGNSPLRAEEPGRLTVTEILIEIAGWTGALLVLGAYFLVSFGQVTPQSRLFHVMNMVGAVGFVINTWWHGALPSAALNVVWFLVGAIALWQLARRRASTIQPR